MAILFFALGVWFFQTLRAIPSVGVLLALGLALTAGAGLMFHRRPSLSGREGAFLLAAIALVTGFLWAAWRADVRLSDALPVALEGRDVLVTGVVAELPVPSERGVRFAFEVETASAEVPRRIQLSWSRGRSDDSAYSVVRPGERWQFTVRLKRPHGAANPNGFDYEAWLLERNLRATGHVRAGSSNKRLEAFVPSFMGAVHRVRDSVRKRFQAQLPNSEYAGVLIALAVGDQRAISQAQWTVFRNTAVAHLISISGLHVSLVALLAGSVAGWGWRRSPWLMLRLPVVRVAALAGLLCAGIYALLAGFGIPTQRAFMMLSVVALALFQGREVQGSQVMSVALLLVLLADPWAVLSAGFWLSFGAVGVIMFMLAGRMGKSGGWRSAVKLQLGITVATIPALLVLFSSFSILSPVANAIAIPLVSFVITPLALLAIIFPFGWILGLAHGVTSLMMLVLEWLAALPFAMWQQAVPSPVLAFAGIVGVGWVLLPRGTPARHAGFLAAFPMLMWAPPRPAPGEFRVTVLDVGQGTAVHVQTATRDLLYDTGPAFGPETDAGERVLVPYFRAGGVGRIDRLAISHDDLDHTGGAAAVQAGLRVVSVVSGLPEDHALFGAGAGASLPCWAGEGWQWDGVGFEILHPAEGEVFRSDNDNSCVLRVVARGGSVLLAGDIEAVAERSMIGRSAEALASSVVVVPHHGSKSSSGADFVGAVAPRHAIHSAGWLNQFRHPHPTTLERWAKAGAQNWRTDVQGAIRVDVDLTGVQVSAERERSARYWHGR